MHAHETANTLAVRAKRVCSAYETSLLGVPHVFIHKHYFWLVQYIYMYMYLPLTTLERKSYSTPYRGIFLNTTLKRTCILSYTPTTEMHILYCMHTPPLTGTLTDTYQTKVTKTLSPSLEQADTWPSLLRHSSPHRDTQTPEKAY